MSAIWITGADGFAGTWLRRLLESQGQQWAAFCSPGRESQLPIGSSFTTMNLAEAARIPSGEAVADFDALPEPSGLIHLAAISSPPVCEAHPSLAQAVNVAGPQRFYESVLKLWPDCTIVQVSSGHVYKPANHPLREDEILEPVNVYGRTKLDGEAMAQALSKKGHRVTVVRPFNHTGAGQLPIFALPSFAMRLAQLEADGGGELPVGWLGGVRDFLHVKQVAQGYLDILSSAGQADLVNLCSGQGQVVGDLLDGLLQRFEGKICLKQDQTRLRGGADADQLIGDTTRLRALLGYVPELDVDSLLDELVADSRSRILAGEDLSSA